MIREQGGRAECCLNWNVAYMILALNVN